MYIYVLHAIFMRVCKCRLLCDLMRVQMRLFMYDRQDACGCALHEYVHAHGTSSTMLHSIMHTATLCDAIVCYIMLHCIDDTIIGCDMRVDFFRWGVKRSRKKI